MEHARTTTKPWRRNGIAALLLLWCAATPAFSQDARECLVLHLNSGAKVSYVLADKPVVTYQGSSLHVSSASLNDEHPIADIDNFTFEKQTSAVGTIGADEIRITVTCEALTIQGLDDGACVTLADIQGRVLAYATADADGLASISTMRYPAGVYIVSASGCHAFKIFKK